MNAQRSLAFALAGVESVVELAEGRIRILIDRKHRSVSLVAKGLQPLVLKDSTAKALAMGLLMAVRRLEESQK